MSFFNSIITFGQKEIARTVNSVNNVLADVGLSTPSTIKTGTSFYDKVADIGSNNPVSAALASGVVATAPISVPSLFAAYPLATIGGGAVLGTVAIAEVQHDPAKAVGAVVKGPGNVQDFVSRIDSQVHDPSLSGVSDIFKEHPFLSTASLVGGALGASSIASTLATAVNTRAVNKNTGGEGSPSREVDSVLNPGSVKTNDHDEDIAKAQAKSAQSIAETNAKAGIDIANIARQQNQDTLDAQLKALSISPQPKATVKTKKKAKKAVKKKKRKNYKPKHKKKMK